MMSGGRWRVGAAAEDRAGAGRAGADRAGLRGRGRGGAADRVAAKTGRVAGRRSASGGSRFLEAPAGRAERRAAARGGRGRSPTSRSRRWSPRTLGEGPPGRTPTGRPGRWPGRDGPVPVGGLADLAGVRPQAARRRDLEAVHGPAVHRQGPRRRRPLHVPAGERAGAVRGREVADPGPGPDRAVPADAAGDPGPDDARLRPQRHDQPVRRASTWPAARSSPSPTAGTATRSSCGSSS